jgi:hypothetical protein
MIILLLPYLLTSLIAVAFFYLLGGIIFNLLKITIPESYLKLFTFLLTGMVASVFFYSIIMTHGNTVFMGLLIPFGFIFSMLPSNKNKREGIIRSLKINYKILLPILIVLLMANVYNFYFLWDTKNNILKPPSPDQAFYARVADYINFTGTESSYLDYHNTANSASPFHFFEIWLTASIA